MLNTETNARIYPERFEAMQLKVCEGCGALWLRSRAGIEVYCRGCAQKLAGFPAAGADRRPGRKRKIAPTIYGGVQ